MHKWTKVLVFILGIAILVSVIGMSVVAFAVDPTPTTTPKATTTPTTSPQDIFLGKLAAKLNVSVDKLKSAFTEARTEMINQLAAEGKITAAQKDWMLNRAQQGPGSGPGMMGQGVGPGMRGHGRGGFNGTNPWNSTPQTTPAPTR
jgi:hypothetical protein